MNISQLNYKVILVIYYEILFHFDIEKSFTEHRKKKSSFHLNFFIQIMEWKADVEQLRVERYFI